LTANIYRSIKYVAKTLNIAYGTVYNMLKDGRAKRVK